MLIPLMRASPSLYINPAQSCGCWAGTAEPKLLSFEPHSRQLETGIKQTPITSILGGERDQSCSVGAWSRGKARLSHGADLPAQLARVQRRGRAGTGP